jgi:hypothetical protein
VYSTATQPTAAARSFSPPKTAVPKPAQDQVERLIDVLRARLNARGARGIIGLGKSFRIMDDNRSRSLDIEEFIKAMRDYGTGLSDREAPTLFLGFDRNRNGSVDYDEFLRFIRGPINARRQHLVD